jgi:hypothetical protein
LVNVDFDEHLRGSLVVVGAVLVDNLLLDLEPVIEIFGFFAKEFGVSFEVELNNVSQVVEEADFGE